MAWASYDQKVDGLTIEVKKEECPDPTVFDRDDFKLNSEATGNWTTFAKVDKIESFDNDSCSLSALDFKIKKPPLPAIKSASTAYEEQLNDFSVEFTVFNKKRARIKPVKRWTNEDVVIFLETIRLDGDQVEKPSSQLYFNKIAKVIPSLGIYGWKGMRDKLRNLKVKYRKAIDWRNNTGDLEPENSIPEYMLKLCPEFELMDKIFGGLSNVSIACVSDLEVDGKITEAEDYKDEEEEYVQGEVDSEIPILNEDGFLLPGTPSTPPPSVREPKKRKLNASRNTTISFLAEVQKERTQYLIDKLALEKKKHFDEMNLKRERLKLEKRKMEEECRLKEKELSNMFELQKLEIEKKIELSKYELELKYKSKEES